MVAVSRAVATGGPLDRALDEIAAQACAVASAHSASILELTGEERFRIVGSHNLAPEYRRMLHEWRTPLSPGRGPSGLAVALGAPVVSEDFQADPRFTEWAAMPTPYRWRALAAFPLMAGGSVLGTLVLYRTEPVPWCEEEIGLLGFFAEHAAVAVRTAQLIDEQRRQVRALERMVRNLREQTHEHANRLHVIGGLLAMDEPEEAFMFVEGLTTANLSDREALDRARPSATLAALLWTETRLARQRSIVLETNVPADFGRTLLSDAQAVTIVGNLLDNAFEAVADMPDERRRVRVSVEQHDRRLTIRVSDRGRGLPDGDDWFSHGESTKPGHVGVGLALVKDAVRAAYGEIAVERHEEGTTFRVSIPLLDGHPAAPPHGSGNDHDRPAPEGHAGRRLLRRAGGPPWG
jgi:signal transduction histidine kinase